MKKFSFVLIVLSVALFTTACSFHSETSIDKSISATKQLDSAEPAKVDINSASESDSSNKPKLPSKKADGSDAGGKCNKHEECNKKDELCLYGVCQSISHIKQSLGFTDDPSFDPCPARPCPNCVAGSQKNVGMGYGIDDVDIQADVCMDCQFNGECNAGFRCLHDLCVDAATNTFCDFFNECLEGYSCKNSKCVKEVAETPSEKSNGADSQKKVVSAPSSGGKKCNKHEECNKADELCYWGTCQTVGQIKQTLGFNDGFSNDPCPSRPCTHCVEGKQTNSGMAYGIDDTNIQASVCIECMFNDACNAGFRCLNEQCVDAATNPYCDFMHECLEGYTCENSQCVKGTAEAPASN